MFATSPTELVEFRKQRLLELVDLAKQLEIEEIQFKKSLAGHIRNTLKNKKLLLFQYLLKIIDIDGEKMVREISRGFSLVGGSFHVDLFPAHAVKVEKASSDLLAEAPRRVKYALSLTRSSGDQDLDQELYNKTLKEKDEGSIDGPSLKLTSTVGLDLGGGSRQGDLASGKIVVVSRSWGP